MLNQQIITAEILKSMSGAVGRIIGMSHPSDVADCVNDAVVRVLSSIDSFDATRGDFKGWASVIAANVARNWRKASANHGHDSEGHADEDGEAMPLVDTLIGTDGRCEVSRRADAMWLAAAIETLDTDAQAFLAAMADGMGQTEAGALVGWSPATSTRRYRAIVETLAAQV